MNKLLSVVSAIGMLAAVSAAQAAEVVTDEQMDIVTAGVSTATVAAAGQGVVGTGTFSLNANNTSATAGTAAASIGATVTPQGIAPHTLALAAAASAP